MMISQKIVSPVLRQEPMSRVLLIVLNNWIPASAGMTIFNLFRIFTNPS